MNILKSLLAITLLSSQVLGAGNEDDILQEKDIGIKTLTIQEGFAENMQYIPENDPSNLMDYFRKTGMMIFPYFTGEDLKDWITAFAAILPKENRLEFTRCMNANFFGKFYSNKSITRIPRPKGCPDVYLPFGYQTMQIIFARFTYDETTTLLTPFLDDLLKNCDLPQGFLFFMRGIGASHESIDSPKNMIDFFKNPSTTKIPDDLFLNPRFIRILFKKNQRQELKLSEKSVKKLEILHKMANFDYTSEEKTTNINNNIRNIPYPNPKLKELLTNFLYRCVMEDPEILGKDRLEAAHKVKSLSSKHYHPPILASLHNIADQSHDLKYKDERELEGLLEEVFPHIQNIENERSLLTFINTPTRFSWFRLEELFWLNEHFQYSPAQLQNCLIPVMENSNDPFFDPLRVKIALKEDSLVKNYYKEAEDFLLFTLQNHTKEKYCSYDWKRLALLERVKELGEKYYPQIYKCLIEIIKDDDPLYESLIRSMLEGEFYPEIINCLVSIAQDSRNRRDIRLKDAKKLKEISETLINEIECEK